jgi:hypothetical protein
VETLSKSFNEHSILWLVLSSLIGGIVGAAIHSMFEEIINPRLRERRKIEKVVRRYTVPILRSADSLRGRIFNFLVAQSALESGAGDGNRTHLRRLRSSQSNKIHRTRLRLLQASVLG